MPCDTDKQQISQLSRNILVTSTNFISSVDQSGSCGNHHLHPRRRHRPFQQTDIAAEQLAKLRARVSPRNPRRQGEPSPHGRAACVSTLRNPEEGVLTKISEARISAVYRAK